MDKPSVYIETSIVSYLAARPSRDPLTLRNQQLTHAWWNTQRERYALWTSDLVRNEAARGDTLMAQHRLAILDSMVLLPDTMEARRLAAALAAFTPLPEQAWADAMHIASAAVHGLAYVLTWNCKHIANPRLHPRMLRVCSATGYALPILITPDELLGE